MKKFTVENITLWGLEQDRKYGGYKLPVSFKFHPDVVTKIGKIVTKENAKDIFYGDSKTAYFRIFDLTKKQKDDLLDKGRQKVDLSFEVNDVSKSDKTGFNYLKLKVIGLRKSDYAEENLAPCDIVIV